ncbi:hypothetical protein EUX98_g9228 [Antrodiella citrinella]|uniref:DNA 3'-5' helicase n=1 Tax=Antrodiella citrinella TaxID=2447956 RepID=A0A4S4M289_9APHY|nr:hypothetical protein EUX98_g9228 [Antrodiella citrinella]
MVSPLNDLSACHVEEFARVGIKAVSLDSDTITEARKNKLPLLKDVAACKFPLLLVSPERLTSPELDTILRSELVRGNLVLYAIDEAHVVVPWSKDFRKAYGNISKARTRIPTPTPLLALTATSQHGAPEAALVKTIGLRAGFKMIRLSREQKNLQLVFLTLTHGLGLHEFPDIAWVSEGKYKTLVYCSTIDLCERVASYLWQLRPSTAPRRKNIRLYHSFITSEVNRQTIHSFDNDPDTFVIVATVKLALGVDVRAAKVCINLGLPETVEQDTQQKGRAGRDRTIDAVGITYVEKGYASAIRKEWESEQENHDEDQRPSKAWAKAADGKSGTQVGKDIDPGLRRLVKSHVSRSCLNAETNRIFGEAISPTSCSPCHEAQRRLPCSSCIYSEPYRAVNRQFIVAEIQDFAAQVEHMDNTAKHCTKLTTDSTVSEARAAPQWKTLLAKQGSYKMLTADMRSRATVAVDQYSCSRWLKKTGTYYLIIPHTAHFPGHLFTTLLDHLHLIRSREALDGILADWKYLKEDGETLFVEITKLQLQFDEEHVIAAAEKAKKAADTRLRRKRATEMVVEDDSGQEHGEHTLQLYLSSHC